MSFKRAFVFVPLLFSAFCAGLSYTCTGLTVQSSCLIEHISTKWSLFILMCPRGMFDGICNWRDLTRPVFPGLEMHIELATPKCCT